jgi:tyrosine-specific transport protein
MGEDIPRRRPHSDLSASFIADVAEQESPNTPLLETVANTLGLHQDASFAMETFLLPVLSASLMITGNTVGAGMLVLPELMQGPGSLLSFGVLTAAWVMNLVSGLAIAQVAIQQKEASGSDVPSSFKEFAEATLPDAASTVSAISIAINTLILAFDIFKAGQIGSSFLPVGEGQLLSYVWGVLLAGLVSTQPLSRLSQVASLLVMGLFGTFASLLLPGLANVHDIGSVLLRGPSVPADQVMDGLMQMTPVVITTLVFQNIVPTVTRLLDYDRTKVTMALTIGSVIPLLMYMAWSVSILGGGIDPSSSLALSGLVSVFSLITVAGSSLGTSMSLSEEFEIILGEQQQEGEGTSIEKPDTFSFASVAAPIGISLLVGQLFSSNITDLLKIAGAFGSPLLYGALPVAMALMQQRVSIENTFATKTRQFQTMVPGGMVGLGALGLGSTALLGSELVETLGHSASML